jgi:glyoxylate/hydroxypyruvate reductase A
MGIGLRDMKPPIPFMARPGYSLTSAWIAALQQSMPEEQFVPFEQLDADQKADCTFAIVADPDPDDVRQLPRLRWVQSVWAGVERLVSALGKTDLNIVRLVDPQLADTMAEAVLAWTLYLHRDMPAYALQQRQKYWQAAPYVPAQHTTVGLLGLGVLGEAAAQRLSAANFKVFGWSRQRKCLPNVICFAGNEELDDMLSQSDILVCLLPLTAQTSGLLTAEKLAKLPKGAQIINFARGPILSDEALLAALDNGHVKHAVLDVFEVEPLPADRWQWEHPRVTVLPHCSAPTNRQTASVIIAKNIRSYRGNGAIPAGVDPLTGY